MKLLVVFFSILFSVVCTIDADAQTQPFAPTAAVTASDGAAKGVFTSSVVALNGIPLFQVASRTDLTPGEISSDNRAILIEDALQQLVATDRNGRPVYDASTLRIWTKRDGGDISLLATDARHSMPLTIVTVTSADAKSQQSTADAIAASWQVTLQNALVQALSKLEPAAERKHLSEVAEIGSGLIVWTMFVVFLLSASQRRRKGLADALADGIGSSPDYDAALRRSRLLHDLKVLSSVSGVLFWLSVLAWFLAMTWAFAQFSQTTAFSQNLSHGATAIVIIWIGVAIINRLCDLAIARLTSNWKLRNYLSSEEQTRVLLRAPTTASVVGHFKTFALVVIAAFLTLSQVGLPIHSVVTIGGVAAIAGTLAAQNFLKDMIGGVAVLYEDQYAIGDLVTINGHTGIVENITLRIVVIRDTNGSAVTISHSSVTSVSNFSRNWSRIDYQLSISPEADPDKAIDVVRETVVQLASEHETGRGLLLPIEWIGVHAFSDEWTLIRASIRTAPLQQSVLHREINRRVRSRLAEANVPYGPAIEAQFITVL